MTGEVPGLPRRALFVALRLTALALALGVTACAPASEPPAAPSTTPTQAVASGSLPAESIGPTAAARSEAPAADAGPGSSTASLIARLQAIMASGDRSVGSKLGFAYLQRIRETADPALYQSAEEAFAVVLADDPSDVEAIVGQAAVDLGRHEFAHALDLADRALALAPDFRTALAARVDALVELGRYDDAVSAAQSLVDSGVSIASMSRVSYLRELHGDLRGALAAIDAAVDLAPEPGEQRAFALVISGALNLKLGRTDVADQRYGQALDAFPDYPSAIAGQGRVALARNDLQTAERRFEAASSIVPLPEYVIALGETTEAGGDATGAARSYDLARVEIKLFQSAGVVVDQELALFEADHGDPRTALELARDAETATPTVRAADSLAWALDRSGDPEAAAGWSRKALRLGSNDPAMLYHAGMIAFDLGLRQQAVKDLTRALTPATGFSPTGELIARTTLEGLGATH